MSGKETEAAGAADGAGADGADGGEAADVANGGAAGGPAGSETGIRVAFQGALGAFSEEAAWRFFGPSTRPVPLREFRDVGDAVEAGDVDFGLLPIENTIAGGVLPSYDVLAREGVEVVGEVVTPIRHCLLGVPGSRIADIRRVISHGVALAQCQRFLAGHPAIEAQAVYDTAGAAADVARAGDRTTAAIASSTAARRYGLEVLAEHVEDRSDNQTRFLVVSRPGAARPEQGMPEEGRSRTALLVDTGNAPGALVRVLQPFADRALNLSRLESRPGPEPWTSRFFIEVDAAADAPGASEAIRSARSVATAVRILGSYRRWDP